MIPQIAGSLLMVISMVVLTLPMTVVVTKFNYAYECDKRYPLFIFHILSPGFAAHLLASKQP